MAMTLKWILFKSEDKKLNIQFGAVVSTYSNCVTLGLRAMTYCLADNPKEKVFWDQSIKALQRASKRTKMFLDVLNVVAMTNCTKMLSKEPLDSLKQIVSIMVGRVLSTVIVSLAGTLSENLSIVC